MIVRIVNCGELIVGGRMKPGKLPYKSYDVGLWSSRFGALSRINSDKTLIHPWYMRDNKLYSIYSIFVTGVARSSKSDEDIVMGSAYLLAKEIKSSVLATWTLWYCAWRHRTRGSHGRVLTSLGDDRDQIFVHIVLDKHHSLHDCREALLARVIASEHAHWNNQFNTRFSVNSQIPWLQLTYDIFHSVTKLDHFIICKFTDSKRHWRLV